MSGRRLHAWLCVLALAVTSAVPCHAQDEPAPSAAPAAEDGADAPPESEAPTPLSADEARAKAMFDEAMTLARKYRLAEACKLLAASEAIDATVITRFWLGRCQVVIGRLAQALNKYEAVIATLHEQLRAIDPESPKHAELSAGLAEVEAAAEDIRLKVPRLTLRLDAATAKLPGLEIKHNGEVVPKAMWSESWLVDLGDHALEVRAPGHLPFVKTVQLSEYGQAVEVPIRLDAEKTRVEQVVVKVEDPIDPLPIVTAAVGVIGIGGIVVGTVVSFSAKSRYDDALATCTPSFCNTAAVDEQNKARKLGNVATGLVIGGAAVTAAAAVMLGFVLFGDDSSGEESAEGKSTSARLGLSPTGASFEMTW